MNEFQTKQVGCSLKGVIDVGRALEARLNGLLMPHGLTIVSYGVLKMLVNAKETPSLSQLAERLNCVRSNVTQLLDRMEADHLVKRIPSLKDRRSIRAAITPKGRALYTVGAAIVDDLERRMLEGFSLQDCHVLTILLDQLSTENESFNERSGNTTSTPLYFHAS